MLVGKSPPDEIYDGFTLLNFGNQLIVRESLCPQNPPFEIIRVILMKNENKWQKFASKKRN